MDRAKQNKLALRSDPSGWEKWGLAEGAQNRAAGLCSKHSHLYSAELIPATLSTPLWAVKFGDPGVGEPGPRSPVGKPRAGGFTAVRKPPPNAGQTMPVCLGTSSFWGEITQALGVGIGGEMSEEVLGAESPLPRERGASPTWRGEGCAVARCCSSRETRHRLMCSDLSPQLDHRPETLQSGACANQSRKVQPGVTAGDTSNQDQGEGK